ncbi:MAG: hypothetical protein J6T96_16380 [Bacteroidales bacterium]|nr:hypothetical protein [Bacteroidales bacterium]MBO7464165.1 hypothetical protein [Bacteroidales bacterium]
MTAVELRGEFLQALNPVFDDESLMRQVMDFIKTLPFKKKRSKKTKAVEIEKVADEETEPEPDSDEYIRAGLREAFKEFKEYQEGKRQFKPLDQYLKELEEL